MRNRGFSPVSRPNQKSQWSTLESGPLAHTNSGILPGFPAKSEELVVHSGKWTTSSYEIGAFPRFLAKSEEPVVHSGEWATSSREIGVFPQFPAKSKEPVVHSRKWATSWHEIEAFQSSPKYCVKICRLSYSLFAFGEVDQEGARIGLPSIV